MSHPAIPFASLIAGLPFAACVCEAPGGVVLGYSPRAATLWGRQPDPGDPAVRFCGSLRLFRCDGTPLAHSEGPMAAVLRGGRACEEDLVIERPDATRVTVRVEVVPLHDAARCLVGALSIFHGGRQIDEDLSIREALYRAIMEDQPEFVCRFGPDGALTFANDAYCRYFGLHRGEVIGKARVPGVHPGDLASLQGGIGALDPTHRVATIERRVFRADGALRWTQWTNWALYDEESRFLGLQATGRDITERRRAEDDAARLAAIVASADDAIVGKTLDGTITAWNHAASTLFGYEVADVIGQPVTIIIPPDRLAEEREILRRVARGDAIERLETERLTRDRRRLPVSLTISPIKDARGQIIGASTIARDITARRRAEQALKASVQALEVLYRLVDQIARAVGRADVCEAALDAVVAMSGTPRASVLVFDEHGVMRFVAWRGLSERYRAAVDGHSPWSPDTADPVPLLIEDVRSDAGLGPLVDVILAEGIGALGFIPLVYQGRLRGKFMVYYDGPHHFSAEELRLTATIAQHVAFGLARVDSEAAIAALLNRERAARQEADRTRAEAERANLAKDEFLAMLAHELRNPLGVIVNALAVIRGNRDLPAESAKAGRIIQGQARHLARLLDELLDVARMTSGRIELERQSLDLRGVVESVIAAQRHRLEEKHPHLIVTQCEAPVAVVGDSVRLQQVLGNLLDNASKYTPAGGSIWVTLERVGGEVVLRVRDNGTGIAPDDLEAIFELFAQANPSLARTEGGMGIGLTLVKRVVELHGGSVRAFSPGLHCGAEVVVRLPVAAAATAAAAPVPARAEVSPRRLLVVEDHDDSREMLATALALYGHHVLQAATGRQGIDMAVQHAPDVVLIDIGLPDVDGYEVGRALRETIGSSVRLVALTGYGQPNDRAQSTRAGFDAHLVKPIDPPRLAEIIERLAPKMISDPAGDP